ncbi:MAG: amidohydrolase family protein [bacterium]|nr:amidohydrolase family protein [bacterium]
MKQSRKSAPGVLLTNANVLDYLPPQMNAAPDPRVETADLRIEGGRIVERGRGLAPREGEEVRDLDGRTVMPGLINAHHHLYSTLAPGMPPPANTPRSFQDVLTEIWWKLDRALDPEAIHMSAASGAWDALRCGATLIFDHHSSLTSVGGSLDLVERGLRDAGVRGCLCYEVTDRGGPGSRDTCLEETRRYLQKTTAPAGDQGRVPGSRAWSARTPASRWRTARSTAWRRSAPSSTPACTSTWPRARPTARSARTAAGPTPWSGWTGTA